MAAYRLQRRVLTYWHRMPEGIKASGAPPGHAKLAVQRWRLSWPPPG